MLSNRVAPENKNLRPYDITIDNYDFKKSFDQQYHRMIDKNCANLLFLDQNGVKHISEDVFKQIIKLKQTDFLFFISSSTIKRFSEHPSIVQHIKLSPAEIEKIPYYQIHRLILDYYKSLIPGNQKYYLAPFSLRKSANVYGLIFGSGHVLGIEKFLTTCWNIDTERGEANFDIDDDKIMPGQGDLFTGAVQRPKKVDSFERELIEQILNSYLKTDKDIYLFTITNGFIPTHARAVIKKMIDKKTIAKCTLDLSSKVCKANATLTAIKIL